MFCISQPHSGANPTLHILSPLSLSPISGLGVYTNELMRCVCLRRHAKWAVCSPLLKSPDFNKRFLVQVYASDNGIGAVLVQGSTGEEQPVEFTRCFQEKPSTEDMCCP